MQTMVGLYMEYLSLFDTALRAYTLAGTTSDTAVGYLKAFALWLCVAHRKVFSLNRVTA